MSSLCPDCLCDKPSRRQAVDSYHIAFLENHQSNSSGNNTRQNIMASQTHSGGAVTSVAQQNSQGVTQQQLQLQQSTTTTTLQNQQGGAPNQMQGLQVIQQPIQNQATLMPHQFYNTQGQLLMPGNIAFHPGLNPQLQQTQLTPSIQVIAAGKTLQPNQLSAPHMFTAATSYATIPTSAAASNQAYIIHPSILQQQQTTKPGDMQKVMQSQLGTPTQIPTQSIWAIPQFLNQNSILIRGTQPEQMFIQQQQPLHNNTSTHQQFATMPLTTGQLPATSISSANTNGVQQVTQQQAQVQQSQSQSGHSQSQPQIATSNIVSIKAQATLQPKPPLQIQPQPAQSQNASQNQQNQNQQQQQNQHLQQQQSQQLSQLQQVAMSHPTQVQMIPQVATSQQNLLSQQILTQAHQGLATQVMQQAQQGISQAPRQLTILPQGATHQIQPQPVTLIQQSTAQHPQPIRPNYSMTTTNCNSQPQGITTTAAPQRAKIRKPTVARGSTNASPTQQAKGIFPRPVIPNTITSLAGPQQIRPAPVPQPTTGATLTKVPISAQGAPQSNTTASGQPLKTINIAALHTPTPNLPDATLTPLMPQATSQSPSLQQQMQSQPVQLFPAAATQLPSPNISITPAPPKKEEGSNNDTTSQQQTNNSQQSQHNHNAPQHTNAELKSENEKENTKTDNSNEDSEDANGKQKLPKALVKPQVLTHVIEGFVIQEASEPFPLGRNGDSDEPPLKKMGLSGDMGKCEMCGKVDLRSKFKKNKRFCSSQCAKSMKLKLQQSPERPSPISNNNAVNNLNDSRTKSKGKKVGDGDSEFTDETSSSAGEQPLMSPSNDHVDDEPKINPVKWNVSEVVDFVRSLPGCAEYADDFAVQEIDGQALMLLKEDHLMSAMGMKLGPALKLCAKIEAIKAGMSNANGDGNQSKS